MKRMSRKTVLLGVISPALFAVAAMAQTFGFHSSFVGSTPDVTIAGVPSGTSPWAIHGSFAHVINGEKIEVKLRGLVRTDTGTASPVTQVSASLVCGADGGSVVSTTDPAPLSDAGDAHFMKPIMVPDVCFAPIVLIQIAGINGNLLDQPANWIAVTGSSN